jgi:hypothetical protein
MGVDINAYLYLGTDPVDITDGPWEECLEDCCWMTAVDDWIQKADIPGISYVTLGYENDSVSIVVGFARAGGRQEFERVDFDALRKAEGNVGALKRFCLNNGLDADSVGWKLSADYS